MRGFNCETAARLGDDVFLVSGWAVDPIDGDERLEIGNRSGRSDVMDRAVFYYRPDVASELERSGIAPAPAANELGVLVLATVRRPIGRKDRWELFLHGPDRPAIAELTAMGAQEAADHLRSRLPYSLHAVAEPRIASHPIVERLTRELTFDSSLGVVPEHEHRRWDASGSMVMSVGRSFVLAARQQHHLVVRAHLGWTGGKRPEVRARVGDRVLEASEWASFETADSSAHWIVETTRSTRVVQVVGLIPVSADDSRRGIATLEATDGDSKVTTVLPLTKPIGVRDMPHRVDAPVVGTALLEIAARGDGSSGIADVVAGHLIKTGRRIPPKTLDVTATPLGAASVATAAVDAAFLASADDVLAFGWGVGPENAPFEIVCHAGSGRKHTRRAIERRVARRDVVDACRSAGMRVDAEGVGFCAWFRDALGEGHGLDELYFSIESTDGARARFRPLRAESFVEWTSMLEKLLGEVAGPHLESCIDELGPALSHAWKHRHRTAPAIEDRRFGEPPRAPEVSIIVPLYGRADLFEHQMAQFAGDPGMRGAELLYFVDDPRIVDEALRLADRCDRLFDLPFRLLSSNRNLGFAAANNQAAARARGNTLLLLNSDVMPKRPKWLPRLLASFGALSAPGALGARLLYEDGTIQHAGIRFERTRLRNLDLWLNEHFDKGLPAGRLPSPGVVEVAAVTAACLMVAREAFETVGGLTEDYVFGDFEDSDFCLKLRERGMRSYVDHDVELYHLERQSIATLGDRSWRDSLVLVNAWLHARRWGRTILDIADRRS